jgi:hypothetical protein
MNIKQKKNNNRYLNNRSGDTNSYNLMLIRLILINPVFINIHKFESSLIFNT